MFFEHPKFKPLYLSLLSGLLLGCGWYEATAFLLVFALIPLLKLVQYYREQPRWSSIFKIWGVVWLGFTVWNFITLWWVWEAARWVAIVAWVANALLQTFPIIVAFLLIRSYRKLDYLIFILCWMSFEYVHLHWELSWTWLNLGHSLMFFPKLAQWYEYTGAFGGTLWILLLNIGSNEVLKRRRSIGMFLGFLGLPMLLSLGLYYSYEEVGTPVEVIVVQPNLDCYTEKFDYNVKTGAENANPVPYADQIQRYLDLSKTYLTDTTTFLLYPETSLHRNKNEANLTQDADILKLQNLVQDYPKLGILTGMQSFRIYAEKPANYTHRYSERVGYYDYFNSAAFITSDSLKSYHKSKLVLGVETMPFKKYLNTLLYLGGGIGGSLGTQAERTVFSSRNHKIAPIICYESIYGEFITEYTKKGAGILGVITNDGWWGKTPGHRQHLAFSALRAIENRRPLARAANTGISAFFDQRGEISPQLAYDSLGALRQQVLANQKITFYVRYGDYLGRGAAYLLLIFIISRLANILYTRISKLNSD